ncbi:glycolate oxidase subunit GlcF [Chloroflexi bacterium TSY]|nr:glycolate oxidase subunit GlcF [Chloroflexi bacterium TSY]
MQHTIPIEQLGPQGTAMAHAVEKCVHCGFCLSDCPTYKVMGEEMDSPRGRIYLMKEELEGHLPLNEMTPYIDRCLGCMACVTACPSGVEYGDLLTPFRAKSEAKRSRSAIEHTTRLLVRETLPYPNRFRLAASLGRLARPVRHLLPESLSGMLELVPEQLPKAKPLPPIYPAEGTQRARVALLAGCVQQVLAPDINWATLRVLARNGIEVIIPQNQGCCGSLSMHSGDERQAQAFAKRNLEVFLALIRSNDIDAIITNAAGCGSGMKEYGLLFKGTSHEDDAREFSGLVQDVSLFLTEIGFETPPPLPSPTTLAYHDACHLAHAQRVKAEPRQLLESIPNVHLVEIPEGELCCGSAGTYNLEQPDLAHQIGERKAQNILSTGADGVVTGNIGCMMQIQTHLEAKGQSRPILHTLEVLDQAYQPKGAH